MTRSTAVLAHAAGNAVDLHPAATLPVASTPGKSLEPDLSKCFLIGYHSKSRLPCMNHVYSSKVLSRLLCPSSPNVRRVGSLLREIILLPLSLISSGRSNSLT